MALNDYLTSEVTTDFADGLLTRREALRRLVLLGVGVTSAGALLAACGGDGDSRTAADDDAAPSTSEGPDKSTTTTTPGKPVGVATITFAGPKGELQAAFAEAKGDAKGALLLIHENRGLTDHFGELTKRFAGLGYTSLAIDLLSDMGGTGALADPATAPAGLAARPMEDLLADLRAGIVELGRRAPGRTIGAMGFCFGGGLAWQLVQEGEPALAAVVPFYGPAPDPANFSKSKAAVLGVYAELDSRVNASRERATAALQTSGIKYEIRTFPGVDHAFFNNTGQRFNAPAAAEAQKTALDWFAQHLK
ncbi:MAG: dienelactone hydrolase family protein [Actinomycetota bacterium]|nr:dienelactone hydrolase family protein [Actinomycetota bacterium]